MAVISSAFAIYHIVLAATNQTVNERYKRYNLCHSQHNTVKADGNCYNRGVLLNLLEEFFPMQIAGFTVSLQM